MKRSEHSAVQSKCPLWVKSGHVQCKTSCPLSARSGHNTCRLTRQNGRSPSLAARASREVA